MASEGANLPKLDKESEISEMRVVTTLHTGPCGRGWRTAEELL